MSVKDPVEELETREIFARARVDERAGFRSELRSRLLAQVGPVAVARHSTPWWALRIPRFALAAVAVVAVLFGGSGLAAAGSLPGEPLYGLKRAAEEVALAVAFDDATRVQRLADQASARLAELRRADGATRAAAAGESARALERLARAATELSGADASAAERAIGAREQAETVLRDLESTLPAEAADGIRRAIEAVEGGGRGGPSTPSARPERAPGVAPEASRSPAPFEPGPRATPPGRAAPSRGQPAVTPPGRDATRSGRP